MSVKITVLEVLKVKHIVSGGTGGSTSAQLAQATGMTLDEVRKSAKALHQSNQVTVHDGVHGKMVKLKIN